MVRFFNLDCGRFLTFLLEIKCNGKLKYRLSYGRFRQSWKTQLFESSAKTTGLVIDNPCFSHIFFKNFDVLLPTSPKKQNYRNTFSLHANKIKQSKGCTPFLGKRYSAHGNENVSTTDKVCRMPALLFVTVLVICQSGDKKL